MVKLCAVFHMKSIQLSKFIMVTLPDLEAEISNGNWQHWATHPFLDVYAKFLGNVHVDPTSVYYLQYLYENTRFNRFKHTHTDTIRELQAAELLKNEGRNADPPLSHCEGPYSLTLEDQKRSIRNQTNYNTIVILVYRNTLMQVKQLPQSVSSYTVV